MRRIILTATTAILAAGVAMLVPTFTKAAGCAPLERNYGIQQTTMSVPVDGDYRLWSRMQASGNSNSYRLVVDNNDCFEVGGSDVSATNWTWIGHESDAASTVITVRLTAGQHQLKFVGTQPGVQLDRVIAASNPECIPVADGSNCDVPPDVTAPTAPGSFKVAVPPFNKAVLTWSASYDAIGVTGYQIYRNGEALAQTTATSYTDTTVVMNGAYNYQVAAYDETGNISERATMAVKTPLKGDIEKPSKPLNLNPTYITSTQVRLGWTASTDNNAVAGYEVWRAVTGGVFAKVATVDTAEYTDTNVQQGVNYTYYVKAVDLMGNIGQQSASNNATPHGTKLATTLIGYVRDASGKGIAGATVQILLDDGMTIYLTTNSIGYYEISNLANGSYSLQYSAAGFNAATSLRHLGENARLANNVNLVQQ